MTKTPFLTGPPVGHVPTKHEHEAMAGKTR